MADKKSTRGSGNTGGGKNKGSNRGSKSEQNAKGKSTSLAGRGNSGIEDENTGIDRGSTRRSSRNQSIE